MRYVEEHIAGKRSPLPYPDETTYNKVRKHLSDFNDRITDEDIRNIKIVGSAEGERMVEEEAGRGQTTKITGY
jgi:hypothetical protein